MTDKDPNNSSPSASEPSGGDNERLSKDEKQAFEKIISEIGQSQQDPSQDASTPSTDDGPDNELNDEQQAALDKIMAEINAGENEADNEREPETQPADSQPEPQTDAELDDEQQAALDKIMAEINAGESDDDNIREPETQAADNQPEPQANAELDDEQQAALDKIMAEINAGGSDDDNEQEPETRDGDSQPEPQADNELDDEQQAALDKIMAEINAGENETDNEQEPETQAADSQPEPQADNELDDEQQAALDKIMAEINAGESDAGHVPESDAHPEDSESAPLPAEEPVDEHPQTPEKDTDRIGNTLNEIFPPTPGSPETSEEGDQDAGADNPDIEEPVPAETAQLSLEEFNEELNKLLAASNVNTESQSPDETGASATNTDDSAADEGDQASDAKPDASSSGGTSSSDDADADAYAMLHEVEPDTAPTARRRKSKSTAQAFRQRKPIKSIASFAVAAMLVACLGVGAYWYFLMSEHQPPAAGNVPVAVFKAPGASDPTVPLQTAAINTEPDPVRTSPKPPQSTSQTGASSTDALGAIKNDIVSARQQVLKKITEVEELKAYYEKGIAEDQANIRKALASSGVSTFEQAKDHPQIELRLRSIQRRRLYTLKLEIPIKALTSASEELLFLQRKTRMFDSLSKGLSGLAIPEFTQEVSTIIGNLLQLSNEVSIDDIQMAAPDLETIWNAVLTAKSAKTASPVRIDDAQDREISRDICRNNFDRKYLLTMLNIETAQCLAKWSGKDLYLNGLRQLTPSQAKALAQWPGEWLSLNGLQDLSAEAAKQLSQWKGKRLSLNGLTHLSKRATQHLSSWTGEQLEMVGLESIGRWENYGTRLYLSEKLRRKLQVQ